MPKSRFTEVYTESNPNPNSLKFVLNYNLLPEGSSMEHSSENEVIDSPFSKELLDFEGIERVFISSNFITLNKKEETNWEELIPNIRTFIKSYFEQGKEISNEPESILDEEFPENELEGKIKMILDEYVKPAVEMDGGAIIFKSFEEGKLKVQLQGSCSGCPSSTLTLKSGIENLMKRMIPEVKMVEAEEA
jgi:NFU1 iron-sulfur cluster scaffold homolog, mitochondrial